MAMIKNKNIFDTWLPIGIFYNSLSIFLEKSKSLINLDKFISFSNNVPNKF